MTEIPDQTLLYISSMCHVTAVWSLLAEYRVGYSTSSLRVKILTRDEETGTLARRLFLSCAPWVKKKGEREKKKDSSRRRVVSCLL